MPYERGLRRREHRVVDHARSICPSPLPFLSLALQLPNGSARNDDLVRFYR